MKLGPRGTESPDHEDPVGVRGAMPLKRLGMEAPAAGPEEFHRAVPLLGKPGLGVVAVCEPPVDILGEEDPGAGFGQDQQQDHQEKCRGYESLHQN